MRPFERIGTYTTFPNEILDHIMPECKHTTWKVVCATVRKTLGWHKEVDAISLSQYATLTGITSRDTLTRALRNAVEEGYLVKIVGETNSYGLNISYEIAALDELPSPLDEPVASPADEPTKESSKDIKDSTLRRAKEKSIYVKAMEAMEQEYADTRPSPLPSWKTKADSQASMKLWRTPMKKIWDACVQDTKRAVRIVRSATTHMKEADLTCAYPVQIVTVAVAMALDHQGVATIQSVPSEQGGRW